MYDTYRGFDCFIVGSQVLLLLVVGLAFTGGANGTLPANHHAVIRLVVHRGQLRIHSSVSCTPSETISPINKLEKDDQHMEVSAITSLPDDNLLEAFVVLTVVKVAR